MELSEKIILGGIDRTKNHSRLKPTVDLNFIKRYNIGLFEILGVYHCETCDVFNKDHNVEILMMKLEKIKEKCPEVTIRFVDNFHGNYIVPDRIMYGVNDLYSNDNEYNFLHFNSYDESNRLNYISDSFENCIAINKFLHILSIYLNKRNIMVCNRENFYIIHSGNNIVLLPFDINVEEKDIWYLN